MTNFKLNILLHQQFCDTHYRIHKNKISSKLYFKTLHIILFTVYDKQQIITDTIHLFVKKRPHD